EVKGQARTMAMEPRTLDVLKDFRRNMRHPEETPHSQTEALFAGWSPNMEAELLGELYNPAQRGSFRAFLHGKQDPNLRYFMVPGGALRAFDSPEEVALANIDPSGDRDGVWYFTHRESELKGGTAASSEPQGVAQPEHYDVESTINGAASLSSV